VWEFKSCYLASAEGDDASDRIVGRNAYSHSVPGHYLDSEAAHAAAQLREHLVSLIALHAIQPAAVYGNHGALNVYQIILAQLVFLSVKDCATS
jgi:hypothetical protein